MSIILFIIFVFVVRWFPEDCQLGRGVDEYDISSRNKFEAGSKRIYVLFPTKTLAVRGTCLYDADETKHGTYLQGYCHCERTWENYQVLIGTGVDVWGKDSCIACNWRRPARPWLNDMQYPLSYRSQGDEFTWKWKVIQQKRYSFTALSKFGLKRCMHIMWLQVSIIEYWIRGTWKIHSHAAELTASFHDQGVGKSPTQWKEPVASRNKK